MLAHHIGQLMLAAAEGGGGHGEGGGTGGHGGEVAAHAGDPGWFMHNSWLIPLIPAVSYFVILFFGKKLPKEKSALIGIAAVGASFLLAMGTAVNWISNEVVADRSTTWWSNGHTLIKLGMHVDGLTVMMFVVVTFISLMVHVYSVGYMHGDVRFTHFFAALSLFTASMLQMLIADNLLQLLIGWELVGLCSFMLIGHWFEEKPNSNAALKAMLTTRAGDVGLLLGVITLFFAAGQNFNIEVINRMALNEEFSHTLAIAGASLLLIGVIGKSAQFPLHIWLPDAMAGPTPVSALIHAATMVVAGVYLVARVYGVFWAGFSIENGGINPLALAGGVTMVIAAALAFVQDDIKRVLAYSTVSQLGYMVAALGVGAWTAGVFHLFTHAFFKALLFLGSGSVIHAVHSNNMSDMGGLKKYMPKTYWTFIIGTVALAGIPPLAGFWSKDEILLGAKSDGFMLIFILGSVGAFMTACYMIRCVVKTFHGEYLGHGHPHESPPTMAVPLMILAVPAFGAGLLNAPFFEKFHEYVHFHVPGAEFETPHHDFSMGVAVPSVLIALAGIGLGLAVFLWKKAPFAGLSERSAAVGAIRRPVEKVLVNKYYLDWLFVDKLVGSIKGPVARAIYWTNQYIIDGLVKGVGVAAKKAGAFIYNVVDQKGVDGVVNGIGMGASETGGVLRVAQSGRIQQYALMLFGAVGALALIIAAFNW